MHVAGRHRLDASATGYVSTGLGNRTPRGTTGLISPSISIPEQGGRMTLDGVEFEFMNTPGAEAPAELLFDLPGFRALCMSEIATWGAAQVQDYLEAQRDLYKYIHPGPATRTRRREIP